MTDWSNHFNVIGQQLTGQGDTQMATPQQPLNPLDSLPAVPNDYQMMPSWVNFLPYGQNAMDFSTGFTPDTEAQLMSLYGSGTGVGYAPNSFEPPVVPGGPVPPTAPAAPPTTPAAPPTRDDLAETMTVYSPNGAAYQMSAAGGIPSGFSNVAPSHQQQMAWRRGGGGGGDFSGH
jgi:hypothetical protein